jgi:hypothetical protein
MKLGNVEQWLILVWKKAFILAFFKIDPTFTKATMLTKFTNGKLAIKQIFYKYLKYFFF